ncbi:maleylpyruvate isomerase family mycothiol-dependent enzyme [Microlunatus panaciterrae]|uniref:Uncharacterized protein (TIGR03083 family) n=2 Tax=Microlunatus panaciterrae TaxID=400768 RepID=A0ABS2RJA4_9ACTN|nr:uncharacterized protein (TIGR03083 family) [Microlunatus panaciterrae]
MAGAAKAEVAAERRELADLLAGLSADDWDLPTLCSGWRVREVVAHVTMPYRQSAPRFVWEMVKSRGNFNAMADRCARCDAARLSTSELLHDVRAHAEDGWKPPGGGYQGALTHEVVHGLDWTTALGIPRDISEQRLHMVLDNLSSPRPRKFFGVDLSDVQLRATDIDWSLGSGTAVLGAAQDLLLVLCGRQLPVGRLSGPISARFTAP